MVRGAGVSVRAQTTGRDPTPYTATATACRLSNPAATHSLGTEEVILRRGNNGTRRIAQPHPTLHPPCIHLRRGTCWPSLVRFRTQHPRRRCDEACTGSSELDCRQCAHRISSRLAPSHRAEPPAATPRRAAAAPSERTPPPTWPRAATI